MVVEYGIATKSGAWYTYEGERLGQGREAAKDTLKKNPDLLAELDHRVRVACGLEFEDEPVGTVVEDADVDSALKA